MVRKYHGFDDEDFPEKKRLEFLDRFYNNGMKWVFFHSLLCPCNLIFMMNLLFLIEFKLQIRLQDGSRKEISVSGRQSVAELVAETFRDSQNNKPIAQTDIFCSNIVEVEDGEVESETYAIGDNSPTASSMLGNTESNLSHDSQTNNAQDGFLNSHWTPHLSEDYRQVLNFRYRFYENLVFRPYVCIQAYLAMGTPGLFPFSYGQEQPRRLASEQSSHRSNSLPSQQQGGFGFFSSASNNNSSASASSGTSDVSQADQDRLQAKRQVQNLESEIKQLEQQKLMGYRDIDSVNEEIQQKRTEINRLRRTYLNGFFSLW